MDQPINYALKNPTTITKMARGMLYLGIVIGILSLISGVLEYQLLSDFKNGIYTNEAQIMAAATRNDTRQWIIALINAIGFFVSVIIILMWTFRMNNNAHALGAADMEFTPGGSIGWYFIPVAYLWKPYQAMKELWMASKSHSAWKNNSTPSILPLWWFIWLISIPVQFMSSKLLDKAETINEIITVNIISLVSDLLNISLCLAFLYIVTKINEMQTSLYSTSVGQVKGEHQIQSNDRQT